MLLAECLQSHSLDKEKNKNKITIKKRKRKTKTKTKKNENKKEPIPEATILSDSVFFPFPSLWLLPSRNLCFDSFSLSLLIIFIFLNYLLGCHAKHFYS